MFIKITPQIAFVIDRFCHTLLVDDYVAPCISVQCDGVKSYNQIRGQYGKYNKTFKSVAQELGLNVNLATYVARHS